MFDLFVGSYSKSYIAICNKKYKDIDACEACKWKKKLCRYFCRYSNKKYSELVADRRKGC